MSFRGAYTTGFIYCAKCATALLAILQNADEYNVTCKTVFEAPAGGMVLGGYVKNTACDPTGSLEHLCFEFELRDVIEAAICHESKIVVVRESGDPVVVDYKPEEKIG